MEIGTRLPPFEPGRLDETAAKLAAAGMTCVEVWVEDPGTDFKPRAAGPAAFGRRLREHGLRVHSIHARWGRELDLSSPDPAARERGIGAALEDAELISAMGGGHVVLHPSDACPEEEHADRAKRCRDSLAEIARRCQGLPATLALENMHADFMGDRSQDLLACVEGLDPARVGFCFDTGHGHYSQGGIALGAAMKGRMFTVHLHDNNGSRDEHLLPFEGAIDWGQAAGVLDEAEYTGPYMFEAGSPTWDEVLARARGVAQRLHALRRPR